MAGPEQFPIGIGAPQSPRDPVVRAFAERGVQISPGSVPALRSGDQNGIVLLEKVLCADLLRDPSQSLKTSLYLPVAQTGMAVREAQRTRKGNFLSKGFLESLSQELSGTQTPSLTAHQLRRMFRAMRADLVSFAITHPADHELLAACRQSAEQFLSDMQSPSPIPSPGAEAINQQWDRMSIRGYYEILYKSGSANFIGVWHTYETEVFNAFYSRTDVNASLSFLDQTILHAHIDNWDMEAINDSIRGGTHIPVDHTVIEGHRNALIYGNIVNPHR